MNHCCCSQSSSFPTFDSLCLIHPPREPSPILFVFWIIQSKREHDVKLCDFCSVDQLNIPLNTCRYYVVVTPEHVWLRIMVPVEYFKAGEGEKADKVQDEEPNRMKTWMEDTMEKCQTITRRYG